MRVITGTARGRVLRTLEGEDVRPTTDRVKEAVFSIIQFEIEGRRVLDLFAGSGQLGIEALSRGADSATFVDMSKDSLATVKYNLEHTKLGDRAKVIQTDALSFLKLTKDRFDIVFIDPPYAFETEACNQLLADLAGRESGELTGEGTVIVLERSTRSDEPTAPEGWDITDRRDYGETAVYYIESAESAEPAEPVESAD